MSFLGISRDSGAVYVGDSPTFGYRCPNEPMLTPFRLGRGSDIPPDEISNSTFNLARRIFRELYFDPVTRLRRGDVYVQEGAQPMSWLAQDPYRKDLGNAFKAEGSRYAIDLVTYQHDRLIGIEGDLGKRSCPRVLLGSGAFTTFWKIVSIESSVANTPVLTLKAEQYLGDLPELVIENVPEAIRPTLRNLLDDVASSVHRLSPVALVDRCRDCLSLVFSEATKIPGADLTACINAWVKSKEGKEDVRSSCARIVARFHSRGKPNEVLAKQLRALNESDAQLALRCLWTVLIEFNWAR